MDYKRFRAPLSARIREFCRVYDKPLFFTACLALVVALLALTGCAELQLADLKEHEEKHCAGYTHSKHREGMAMSPTDWQLTREPAPQPWLYLYVERPNETCRFLGSDAPRSATINGCAVRDFNSCLIILPIYLKPTN